MKISFIYPGIAMTGFDSFKKVRTNEANFIDHGLSSLSAVLKQKDHHVGLIDLRTLGGWDDFRQRVERDDADLYGLTAWSLHYRDARECGRIIKEVAPHKPVVWGGVHATLSTSKHRIGFDTRGPTRRNETDS